MKITNKLNYCMNQKKCNYKLYKLRLLNNTPLLFGGPACSEEWSAPCNAILNDFHQKEMFEFAHPKFIGKKYKRHYARPAYNGIAELKVGQFRTNGDYARVFINIVSDIYEPYVACYNYQSAFSNAELLAEIVERAFNWILKSKMLCVKLVPWVPAKGEKIFWMKDCCETFDACERRYENDELMDFGFEKLKKKTTKRKISDFKSYILYGYEDKVMAWLHRKISCNTNDIAMFMRPMRAMAELKLFNARPPLITFCNEFGKEGLIKKTAYNEYMNTDNDKCDNDCEYKAILKSGKEYFSGYL